MKDIVTAVEDKQSYDWLMFLTVIAPPLAPKNEFNILLIVFHS